MSPSIAPLQFFPSYKIGTCGHQIARKVIKVLTAGVFMLVLVLQKSFGQQHSMPQDNWTYGGMRLDGNFGTIAVGPDNNLYASTGGLVAVYDRTGMLLGQRGSNLNIAAIALDSATNLYVLDPGGTNVVLKYSALGVLIRTFASLGTNENQVTSPLSLAVGRSNQVYVVDGGNKRIQVYDQDGTHLFHWGAYAGDIGGLLGRFSNLEGIAAMPNGDIAVRNGWDCCGSSPCGQFNRKYEIQLFGFDGTPLAIKSLGQATSGEERISRRLAVTPDGLLAVSRSRNDLGKMIDLLAVYPGDSTSWSALKTLSTASLRFDKSTTAEVSSIAFDADGTMYVAYCSTFGGGIQSARRFFEHDLYGTNRPPLPYILSVQQRPDSSLVDIDYRVISKTSTNVATGLLVFVNNGNDFASLRIPHSFVEGTATNLGFNRPANVVQRVTWDASELATSFVNLQFELLAKDDRGLLPWSFITVPASQTQTTFTMSRSGTSDSDLLSVWYWLLATNHPGLVLTNGVIRGVGGTNEGALFTNSGVNTTTLGRPFLYEIMGLREPTTTEVSRASSGNFGFLSVSIDNAVKR